MIGFDTELTQFGLENPTSKISSFHLADESKFNRLAGANDKRLQRV